MTVDARKSLLPRQSTRRMMNVRLVALSLSSRGLIRRLSSPSFSDSEGGGLFVAGGLFYGFARDRNAVAGLWRASNCPDRIAPACGVRLCRIAKRNDLASSDNHYAMGHLNSPCAALAKQKPDHE